MLAPIELEWLAMEIRPTPVDPTRRAAAPIALGLVVLGVVAVLLALILFPGAGTQPAVGLTAGADPTATPPATSGPGPWDGWGGAFGKGMGPGRMADGWVGPGVGGGRGFGGVLGAITITAIDGTNVSLRSANGWTRTIDVSGVTINRAGSTVTAGDLKVGDYVVLRESRTSDGTFTLQSVTVVLDRVSGTVTAIDSASITVRGVGGGSSTVTTSAATTYRRGGQTISRSDIAVGERLTAVGTTAADGSLAAEAIDVQPDGVFGVVTAKSGSTLTIATAGGGTATVKVTSSTTYDVAGKSKATLDDVAVNDSIVAQGVLGSDGTLTATSIRAGVGRGFGHGGFGPSWRGFGPGPKASPAPTSTPGTSG